MLVENVKVYHFARASLFACIYVYICTHKDMYSHRLIHSRHDIVESANGAVEKRRKKITRPLNISDSSRTEE